MFVSSHIFFQILVDIFLPTQQQQLPAPYTEKNRVLSIISAFNLAHVDSMLLIFQEWVSVCEGGWRPSLLVYTAINWTVEFQSYVKRRTYCSRVNGSLPMAFSWHHPNITIGLPSTHRFQVAQHIDSFDVFVYQEDDILFKFAHLSAYVHETTKLNCILSTEQSTNIKGDYKMIGFQRFRRDLRVVPAKVPHFGGWKDEWHDENALGQDFLEEVPTFTPVCFNESPYLRVDGNPYQACWVMTREQVLQMQERCAFLNQSAHQREYMASMSIFLKKLWHCGVTKVIPGDKFHVFTIRHYFPGQHKSGQKLHELEVHLLSHFLDSLFCFMLCFNVCIFFPSSPSVQQAIEAGTWTRTELPTCWKQLTARLNMTRTST